MLVHDPPGSLSEPDVIVVHWPADAELREQAAARGDACLMYVAERARPPLEWGHLEDWLREPVDYGELDARRTRLRRRLVARQPVWIDDDGLLRRGSRWIALAPLEVKLLEPLLAMQDEVVCRRTLHAEIYHGDAARDVRLVDSTMRRLRRRVRPFGVTIHTVRGTGFLLDVGEPPD
jgi:DNA-binding response OmpR family regulator